MFPFEMKKHTVIADELLRCELELSNLNGNKKQDIMYSPTYLGVQVPEIPIVSGTPNTVLICGKEVTLKAHKSLTVSQTGPIVNREDEQSSMAVLFDKICTFKAFKEWCHNFDPAFFKDATMTQIEILSVYWFGPNIGFLKFVTNLKFNRAYCEEYKRRAVQSGVSAPKDPEIPSVVFMRGASVTILVIITSDSGMRYSVLVVQPRAAIGRFSIAELPAGMIDQYDSFVGTAAKELQEETGLKINPNDLEDLTEDMGYDKAYPSCGGCDEYMKFYLYQVKMGKQRLQALQNKCTGAYEEGENIKVKIVPFDRLAEHSPDMKTLSALYLYEQRCKRRALMYSTYGGGRIIGQSYPNDKIQSLPDDN